MANGRRVVVTGLGVATPIGVGIETFWDGLIEKRCGIERIQGFDPSGLLAQVGGELPPIKLGDCIPKAYRKSAKVMSRDIVVAVLCAYRAVKDAGLNTKCIVDRGEASGPPNIDSTRFGANIGAGLICADLHELADALATAVDEEGRFSLTKWGDDGMTNLTPLWLLKFLPNMLACHVTIVHDAQAPSNTITCGEASSHLAIGEAFRTISRGAADACICGGAECKVSPMEVARQQLFGRLNVDSNDSPNQTVTPFGAHRSGTAAADGGGLIVLEALEHAESRGARIYAEVVGFGASSNTQHWSKPDADGAGMAVALRRGLVDADIKPAQVDLVAPFGLGTVEHDAAEMAAWNAVFGDQLERAWAIAPRAAVGNNGAGSGAIDFSAAVISLHRNTVPPTLNVDELDPTSRFRFASEGPIDANITCAITVGAAAGGGQNAALVIKKLEG